MAMSDTFGMPQKRRRKKSYSSELPKRLAKKRAASDSGVMVPMDDDAAMMPFMSPDGALITPDAIGGIFVDSEPQTRSIPEKLEHDANLAEFMEESDLGQVAETLLEGIEDDDQSRSPWLQQRADGIKLLGWSLDDGKSGQANSPVEFCSTARHPLLAEAVLRGKANARGELLPASGPVKVRNDGEETNSADELARVLERDMNHYLTCTASEYYDDTDRMLFWTFFGGSGFKKVYNCPIRRRPVSESVDAKDMIISNDATDIRNAKRVTQAINMRKSVMKRMMILDVYRDVDLTATPAPPQQNAVDSAINQQQGLQAPNRPDDQDYELYECYCELDLPGFEHKYEKGKKRGKPSGLPLPYRVTIERDSRKILEIRRNWEEGDTDYTAKQVFVHYKFETCMGLYGIGLVHILGNTTNALTAIWREVIDAGMFANFPGFLYSKDTGSRNASNQFRVAPGSGVGIDTGDKPITSVVMPLPYKSADAGFVGFADMMAQTGARLGGASEIMVGESNSEAKTGATMALIEQGSKLISAVHKRLHSAQSEEFRLLRDEFKKDPSALWKSNKRAGKYWNEEKAIAALENYALVPCADPNVPSQMHRLMKATAIKQIAMANPGQYDMRKVDARIMREIGVADPETMFAPEQPAMPDPKVLAKAEEIKVKQGELALKTKELDLKGVVAATDASIAREQMISDENIEALRVVERLATNPDSNQIVDDQLVQMRDFLHPTAEGQRAAPPMPPMMPPMAPPQSRPPMPPQGMV